MAGLLKHIGRKLLLNRLGTPSGTGIVPLSQVHSATVLADSSCSDVQVACDAVRQFFGYHGIPVTVICPRKGDLTFMGRLRKKFRIVGDKAREEDLFISLVADPECFAAEYEMKASRARFKVGALQYSGNAVDLVVSAPEGSSASQSAIFAAIKDYLTKIK